MSSILKALKKLESTAPPRTEDAAPSLHRAMNVRRSIHNRFKTVRLLRHLFLVLAGGLLLVVIVWGFHHRQELALFSGTGTDRAADVQRPAPPPDRIARVTPEPADPPAVSETATARRQQRPTTVAPRPAPRAPSPQPATEKRAPSPPPSPTEKRMPATAPADARPPEAAPAPPLPDPAPERAPRQRTAPAEPDTAVPAGEPATATGPDPGALARNTPPPTPPPRPIPRTAPPAASPPAAARSDRPEPGAFTDVVQRTDPRFHIQALVWSPEPEGRMAMVNGDIVKTGGIVAGAEIVHIGENFLIFQEQGNRWRHPFRVK